MLDRITSLLSSKFCIKTCRNCFCPSWCGLRCVVRFARAFTIKQQVMLHVALNIMTKDWHLMKCPSWINYFSLKVGETGGGGISSSVLSVFFTDKFALSQSDARISVAYNSCQWKTLTKHLMKCPPGLVYNITIFTF